MITLFVMMYFSFMYFSFMRLSLMMRERKTTVFVCHINTNDASSWTAQVSQKNYIDGSCSFFSCYCYCGAMMR